MIQIIKNQKLKSYFIFCNVEITSYNNIIKGRDGLAMLKSGVFSWLLHGYTLGGIHLEWYVKHLPVIKLIQVEVLPLG